MKPLTGLLMLAVLAPQEDVDRLIRRLSHEDVEVREAAQGRLIRMGESARPALQRAVRSSDTELNTRVKELLKRLDVYAELRPWYAPESRVTLSGKMTLEAAIREIEKQSGQKVARKDRPEGEFRIKLNDVPFWQALDRVCAASGKRTPAGGNGGPRLLGNRYVNAPSKASGPFRLGYTGLTESREFTFDSSTEERTLTLSFVLAWETTIDPVRSFLELERMEDEKGMEWLQGFQRYQNRIYSGYRPAFLDQGRTYVKGFFATTADPPGPDRTRFSRIRGTVTVFVRGAKGDLDFPIPAPGKSSRSSILVYDDKLENHEKVAITLSDVQRKGKTVSCRLDFQNVDVRLLKGIYNYLYLRDQSKNKYQGIPRSISQPDRGRTFTLRFDNVPADAKLEGLTVLLPRKLVRKDIPFDLKDIPLR